MVDLDLLDRRLLYELDMDARLPASQLAKKLRKSKETINFRINRLIHEKYLKGFYTVINTSKLGWYYHKMYFHLKSISPGLEEELFNYLKTQPKVAYLASMEGPYDGVCLIFCKSSNDMDEFLRPFMKKYGELVQDKEFTIFLTTRRLNQKFIYSGSEQIDWHYPVELGYYNLDDTDSKILGAISSDARLPLVDIAKAAGVDAKVVKYRLKKLENDGIVLAYVTAPNFEKLGLQFIQINISLVDPSIRSEIIHYFDSTNKCLYAMEMIGKYDLAIELHVQTNQELKAILDGFRKKYSEKIGSYDLSTINHEYVVEWGPFKAKD